MRLTCAMRNTVNVRNESQMLEYTTTKNSGEYTNKYLSILCEQLSISEETTYIFMYTYIYISEFIIREQSN